MVVVTYGPPTTTRLPRALHLSTMRRKESFCTSIALAKTMSAHSISDVFNECTFKSTSRRFQDRGSSPETVKRPSGGKALFHFPLTVTRNWPLMELQALRNHVDNRGWLSGR